jgi:Alpha-L-fucosidase
MSLASLPAPHVAVTKRDSSWMRGRWGVFLHYLADGASATDAPDLDADTWNRRVDSFAVDRFADAVATAGAAWVGLTLGQNSGFYCSPNPVYDSIVGRSPSRLSRRDLVGDLAVALERRGLRTMAYLPSHAPSLDRQAVHALRCTPAWDCKAWSMRPETLDPDARARTDERLTAFQEYWQAIITHWSQRWGPRISAWWFDGCYHADRMYRHPEAPNFASFAAAARSGNPQALVAMNGGVLLPVRPQLGSDEDYTAGELSGQLPIPVASKWAPVVLGPEVDGRQRHYFTFLGHWWGVGPTPRLGDGLVADYTAMLTGSGAAMTWDLPVAHDGSIGGRFLQQLVAIRNACVAPASNHLT